MNIKITYNWLKDYLETDASPSELQEYLSLCGPSFERTDKTEDDYVFDIEVTTNRVDMASVFGIAQEAQAILPQFGKQAKLKLNPIETYIFKKLPTDKQNKVLNVQIQSADLCSRFTAIILSNIQIGESPDFIKKRLTACGINSINNVIDITNYLMLSLGQPTHAFDYDKIAGQTMIMRESKPGETITTLDGKVIKLPGGDIVMEDANKQLFDLCGIMGGQSSMITNETKNVILFVQTYNKRKIRRTSMTTGQRTDAATYFEKDMDEERVEPTLVYGVELLQKYAGGTVDSKLYDIYPNPYKPKTITVSMNDITRVMGIDLEKDTVVSILTGLGFTVEKRAEDNFIITVPSWRSSDISIKEDIVEEVARVYGYHRLPNTIQTTTYVKQPADIELLFALQQKIKYFLKHIGIHESMNYSMVSEELLKTFDLNPEYHLMLANTISEEIKYMRQTLLPSLIKNVKDNTGKKDILKLFEIAKIYIPRKSDLPDEQYKLSIVVNTDFFDLKGIIESLLRELHISDYDVKLGSNSVFSTNMQADLYIGKDKAGTFGQIKSSYSKKMGLEENAYAAELDLGTLIKHYRLLPSYKATNPFAVIKLDLTIELNKNLSFAEIKEKALNTSSLLKNVEFLDMFKNKMTFRFYFSSTEKNITEEDAKKELENIKTLL